MTSVAQMLEPEQLRALELVKVRLSIDAVTAALAKISQIFSDVLVTVAKNLADSFYAIAEALNPRRYTWPSTPDFRHRGQ